MRLNDLHPARGARRPVKRVARGAGSGTGKTAARGHKGQRSRSGGGKLVPGFEGGQMPLARRLPKFGFVSRTARFGDEVRLDTLARLDAAVIDIDVLKQARLIPSRIQRVKVIASGSLDRAITVKGLAVTRGARAAIEAAGGKIED